jgi:hypothetical protein
MKYNIGDILVMKNGSEYLVGDFRHVGTYDSDDYETEVYIIGETGIGYWFKEDYIESAENFKCKKKDVYTMTDLKVGDKVRDVDGRWFGEYIIRAIYKNDVLLGRIEGGEEVAVYHRDISDVKKVKTYPYRFTDEEFEAHMNKIGTKNIILNDGEIMRGKYAVEYIEESDKGKYKYWCTDGTYLREEAIGEGKAYCNGEFLWYLPHLLTKTEREILIKKNGTTKFHIDGWNEKMFEVIGIGTKSDGMDSYRVAYNDTNDANVPMKSFGKTCHWFKQIEEYTRSGIVRRCGNQYHIDWTYADEMLKQFDERSVTVTIKPNIP